MVELTLSRFSIPTLFFIHHSLFTIVEFIPLNEKFFSMDKWLDIVRQKLETWLTGFVKMIPNIVVAALVFTFFFFAARLLRKLVYKLLFRLSEKKSISDLFSNIFFLLMLFVGLFVSLQLLHLEKTVSSLLAGAGIVGLALGFAFQDLTANFISGVFIIFRKPFEVGQIVDTNGFVGIVEDIQLRSTTIRTNQGLHIMLPNKDIFQKPITNYSLSAKRRADIALTIPAKANVAQVEPAIRQALANIDGLDKEKDIEINFTDYNGDTLKLEIWCWINNEDMKQFIKTRDQVIKKLHDAVTHLPQQ